MNKFYASEHKKKQNTSYELDTEINVVNDFETINKLSQGYSISRFGDGEMLMMTGENMAYEKHTESLMTYLTEILKKVKSHPKLLVGIPLTYLKSDPNLDESSNKYWNYSIRYLKSHKYINLLTEKEYYSSFFTQLYAYNYDYREKILNKIINLFANRHIVLFVNSKVKEVCESTIEILFKNSIDLVYEIVPSSKAWIIKDELMERMKQYEKDRLILICCGATASIMAYEGTMEGYQVIDLGQLIEGAHSHYNNLFQ